MTDLVWEGCVNVRDLGGLPTADGRRTRLGRIVRADNIRELTDRGWQALLDHDVRRIVDLRFQRELDEDAVAEAPVEVVHVPLLGEWTEEWQAEFNAAMDEADSAERYLVWSYVAFLERYRANFAAAIEAIADLSEGAVLVHCMGGKDRTGLISALMLRLAGVEVEVVAADYARSEVNLAPEHEAWVAAAPDPAEARRRRLLLPAPATAMLQVLEVLETQYGGVDEYLRGAGVSDEALDRLRGRLVA